MYGEGRHISAYPQTLEARDDITTALESRLGNRLVDQNDPTYRLHLGTTGTKNTPISRGVSARFTTDYLGQDPVTGKPDFSQSFSFSNPKGLVEADEKYLISGIIDPEEIEKINRVISESPEMATALHGEVGYVSPYKTIEQIAEDRSTRKIPITNPPTFSNIRNTYNRR
jgi:hypothetical protein